MAQSEVEKVVTEEPVVGMLKTASEPGMAAGTGEPRREGTNCGVVGDG